MKDYKKIIKGVIGIIKTTQKTDIGFANICSYLSDNCDELFEDEDERIRRELIRLVYISYNELYPYTPTKEEYEKMTEWLEKQKDKDALIKELSEYKVKYTQKVIENGLEQQKLYNNSREDELIKKEIINAIHELKNIKNEKIDSRWLDWLEKQKSVGEIVERCKTSWYNEGKIAGMAEGLTDDEKYQQGWHDALEKQGEKKSKDKYTFNAIPRLLEMIEPTDRAKSYCQKLIDSLLQEGYTTDAKIVSDCLKQMNSEKVAMATMDEQKHADKAEPKFKVKYACGEYNVVDEIEMAGVTFYGIEDEPNHIDYVKADTCEIINAKPKFKVGDWITNKGHSYLIASIDYEQGRYLFEIGGYTNEQLNWEYIKNADEKYHLWSIQDAKDGDVLVDVYGNIGIYEKCVVYDWISYCSLGNYGGFQNFSVPHEIDKTHPATKEQRELLFKKMRENGYYWNRDTKTIAKY